MSDGDQDLQGIRGWLALFLACLSFVALALAADLARNLVHLRSPVIAVIDGYDLKWLEAGKAACKLPAILLCAFMAWRLAAMRNRRTVEIVIAGLWLVGFGEPLVEILIDHLTVVHGNPGRDLVGSASGAVLFSLPWTLYFLRSRRVANTYKREAERRGISDIFA